MITRNTKSTLLVRAQTHIAAALVDLNEAIRAHAAQLDITEDAELQRARRAAMRALAGVRRVREGRASLGDPLP